jgi:(p)ppGpp synthase/HD superfamily hydrolase
MNDAPPPSRLLDGAQTILRLYRELLDAGRPAPDVLRVKAAYELATTLFAGRLRSTGNTFLAHLVGTASITAMLGGDVDLVLAALLHAAYAVGDFGDGIRGVAPAHRALVCEVIGARAEDLVRAYQEQSWQAADIEALCARVDALDAGERSLLLLRLANELEDHRDRGMAMSGARRQSLYRDSFPALVAMAERLRQPALAAALARVADENYGAGAGSLIPPGLASDANGSYVVLPGPVAVPVPTTPAAVGWRRVWQVLTRGGRATT